MLHHTVFVSILILILTTILTATTTTSGSSSDAGIVYFDVKNIYFLHIMKCGGSTLDLLFKIYAKFNRLSYVTSESNRFRGPNHNEFSVVVVRNATERIISHYWQVLPGRSFSYVNQTRGRQSPCSTAALKGFDSYISSPSCRVFVNNFQSSYLSRTIHRKLAAFSLVIPHEFYDQGLLLLHTNGNVKVIDIIYGRQKVYNNPQIKISPATKSKLLGMSQQDNMLHQQAMLIWDDRYGNITRSETFQSKYNNYVAMLKDFSVYVKQKTDDCMLHVEQYDNVFVPKKIMPDNKVYYCYTSITTDPKHKKDFCSSNDMCSKNEL